MAIPGSGQLRLRADIALEVDGNATGTNVSLRTLSSSAGFTTPDAMSEFYGYTSAIPPTVTTTGSSRTNNSFYMTGTVNSDNGSAITERGFYFGTSSNRASNPKYVVAGTTGNFNFNKTGLAENTTYYYWAYATNPAGTTYGNSSSGTTYPTLNYTWETPYGNYTMGGANGWQMAEGANAGGTCTIWGSVTLYHPYLGSVAYKTFNSGSQNTTFSEVHSWRQGEWTGGTRGDFRTRAQVNFNYTGAAYKSDSSDGYYSAAADGAFYWYKGGVPAQMTTNNGYGANAVQSHVHNGNQTGTEGAGDPNASVGYFWVLLRSYNQNAQSYNGFGWLDVYK